MKKRQLTKDPELFAHLLRERRFLEYYRSGPMPTLDIITEARKAWQKMHTRLQS